MHITKRPVARRTIQAPPAILLFIQCVLDSAQDDLPALLRSFDQWSYPKGDLFQWADVLDKFDDILDALCTKYSLDQVQVEPFTASEKELLTCIVKFSVFLLDHCANRNLYSSANNINKLLYTTDIDVLEQVCSLTLRLAQRASQQRNRVSNFTISLDRLWKIAMSLQSTDPEHGPASISMPGLLQRDGDVPDSWKSMSFWYYRTKQSNVTTSATSTTQGSDSKEGMTLVKASHQSLANETLEHAHKTLVQRYAIPSEHHFEVMLRLRFSKNVLNRQVLTQLINLRILALASLAYLVVEPVLQARLFSTDPLIISQLVHLLQPEHGMPQTIRASVLYALEALAHHRSKLGEVLNGVGASINHGLLMYVLRDTVQSLEQGSSPVTSEFLDALIGLLHYLCTTNVAGSMLCSAGLVPILVLLLKNERPDSLRAVVKSLTLLDHLLYGFPQSFEAFVEADGLTLIVNRIAHEVDLDIANDAESPVLAANVDYRMTHERFSLLKNMLKFVVHMMQSSGTTEGLRNLIESSLLQSLKKVYQNSLIFGSSIFASSTNIMSTFIHNEPTSFPILSEAGLPKAFIDSVLTRIFPASDSLTAIPNAFGAICLNSSGLALFTSSGALTNFFAIFCSAEHCEALREADIGGLLGSSIDELIRHHPALKPAVMNALVSTIHSVSALDTVTNLDTTVSESHSTKSTYRDEDNVMRPIIVAHIDVFARFLEGLLQNSTHAQDFVNHEGTQMLLDLYKLNGLPHDFAKSHAALSLSHVFRLLCESSSTKVLNHIFKRLDEALGDLSGILSSKATKQSYFEPYVNEGAISIDLRTNIFPTAELQRIHALCVLLSDLYSTPVFSHGRSSFPFFQGFAENPLQGAVLNGLGSLHRRLMWEDVVLSSNLPPAWLDATQPKDENADEAKKAVSDSKGATEALSPTELASLRCTNLKVIRFFLCQIPPCIIPFYQGLSKMLVGSRRAMEQSQRISALQVGNAIAQVFVLHLDWQVPDLASRSELQSYYIMVLTALQMLLTDERSHSFVTTCVLVEFLTGVDKLIDLLLGFWQDLQNETVTEVAGQKTNESLRVLRTLKLILHLLQQFTNPKALLESPQTIHLDSGGRNKDKTGYFHPRNFLQHLRNCILQRILPIWNNIHNAGAKLDNSILSSLISLMTQLVVKDGSDHSDPAYISAAHGTITSLYKPREKVVDADLSGTDDLVSPGPLSLSLEESREIIRNNCIRTSVDLLAHHTGALFDLSTFIVACVTASQTYGSNIPLWWFPQGIQRLFSQLEALEPAINSTPAHARDTFRVLSHLLAKIVNESAVWNHTSDHFLPRMQQLISLLERVQAADRSNGNQLLANLFVALDAFLSHEDTLRQLHIDREGQLLDPGSELVQDNRMFLLPILNVGMAATESRVDDKVAVTSVLRLLVRLTKQADLAAWFTSQGGVKKLLAYIEAHIWHFDETTKIIAILVLRHCMEDPETLSGIVEREIRTWFAGRTRLTDISNFVKQSAPLILRNPKMFIDIVHRLCYLPKYDPATTTQAIALRNTEVSNSNEEDHAQNSSNIRQGEGAITQTIYALATVIDAIGANKESVGSSEQGREGFELKANALFLWQCFLFSALTEMLQTYQLSKLELMQNSNQLSQDQNISKAPAPAVLNLIHLLMQYTSMETGSELMKKEAALIQDAIRNNLSALCFPPATKFIDADLMSIRKATLLSISKSTRDAIANAGTARDRCDKILASATLVNKLLMTTISKEIPTGNPAPSDTNREMAKMMLESNFVHLLASVLADIDLQFPGARQIIKAVLRPLKTLTKTCLRLVELGEAPQVKAIEASESENLTDTFEHMPVPEEDTMHDADREDTPDLYRNSALAMFGTEIHTEDSLEDDYDTGEEDLYEEMDFEEDGSETGSAVSDEDLGLDEASAQQHEVEIILDEDDDDDDDDDDDNDNEDDDEDEQISDEDDDEETISSSDNGDDRNAIDVDDVDETVWHEGHAAHDSMDEEEHAQAQALMQNLRATLMNDPAAEQGSPGAGSIVDVEEEDPDEVEVDEEDIIMQDAEYETDTYDEPEDQWTVGHSVGGHHLQRSLQPRSLASRLWASIAPGGDRQGPFPADIELLQRSSGSGILEGPGIRERQLDLSNPVLSATTTNTQNGRIDRNRSDEFAEWIESIEALIGGGAVQLIGDIMQRPGPSARGPRVPAIRLEVSSATGIRHIGTRMPGRAEFATRTDPHAAPADPMHEVEAAVAFASVNCLRRYGQESSILYGSKVQEKALIVINHLLRVMIPEAIAERAKEQEQQNQMVLDKTEAPVQHPAQVEETVPGADDGTTVPMETSRSEDLETQQTTHAEESTEAAQPAAESQQMPDAPETVATPRQTIVLRGQEVDITGLGIDLEFLAALPDDMREEVVTQHIREHRASSVVAPANNSGLATEFLEALPPDLRAELLHQEASERRRLQRESRPQTQNPPGQLSEIDTASFLASLDPALRQSILIEQDDEFLDQLPAHMIAEVGSRREQRAQMLSSLTRPRVDLNALRPSGPGSAVAAANSGTTAARKDKSDGIQLVDRAGICSLTRLLFLSWPPQRNMLHDILLNLCDNRHSRMEILSQLLNVLNESSTDVQSTERCLASLSRRSKAVAAVESPVKTPRKAQQTMTPEQSTSLTLLAPGVSPSLVALQSVQAMAYLVTWNERVPSYFLSEHELSSRKGKLKSKAPKYGKYPINTLLALLGRPFILGSADLLEPLANLLSSITRPLMLLNKHQATAANVQPTDAQAVTPENAGQGATAQQDQSEPKAKPALQPPDIPAENVQSLINIITADVCSGKTFQHTLATVHHISAIQGAGSIFNRELTGRADWIISKLEAELVNLHTALENTADGVELQNVALSDFSSASSYQAKLLRILKSIDYAESRSKPTATSPIPREASCFDAIKVDTLWLRLSQCLKTIEEKTEMLHIATVLLPLIESLIVVCKHDVLGVTDSKEASRQATPMLTESYSHVFYTFTEQHKRVLNQMVRSNPGLMSGSFALLTKNPRILDFDNKRSYFCRQVRDRGQDRTSYPPISLHVRREAVFLDSYKELHFKSGDEIKFSKLNIKFAGEEGIDAGGVSREWFQVLSRQMFDPNYALFVPVNSDRNTYHPNKASGINPEHLLFFRFVGRIIGKALYDGRLLDCHFSRPVYRKILGKKVALKDMETLDLDYYKSLVWMLDNDISDIITETFSIERDDFGVTTIVDLIPNGSQIPVTEANKQEYVERVTEHRLLESVSEQLEHFMKGFNEIISPDLVSIFNEQELELLISGLPDIDSDDWKNNTEYHNYTAASPQIQWFWRAVRSFNDEERARLLQFSTGSSRIPIEGFASLEGMHGIQKFNIHRDYNSGARLPQSHTCFNQLDLPEYDSYDTLRKSLLLAISEGNEGFGFA